MLYLLRSNTAWNKDLKIPIQPSPASVRSQKECFSRPRTNKSSACHIRTKKSPSTFRWRNTWWKTLGSQQGQRSISMPWSTFIKPISNRNWRRYEDCKNWRCPLLHAEGYWQEMENVSWRLASRTDSRDLFQQKEQTVRIFFLGPNALQRQPNPRAIMNQFSQKNPPEILRSWGARD